MPEIMPPANEALDEEILMQIPDDEEIEDEELEEELIIEDFTIDGICGVY